MSALKDASPLRCQIGTETSQLLNLLGRQDRRERRTAGIGIGLRGNDEQLRERGERDGGDRNGDQCFDQGKTTRVHRRG